MSNENDFLEKHCTPCEGKGNPLPHAKTEEYLKIVTGWSLGSDRKFMYRNYVMKNFMAAIRFVNNVAQIAESENHHPDIHLTGYRKLRVELTTHALGGLSENDFIVARKINEITAEIKP